MSQGALREDRWQGIRRRARDIQQGKRRQFVQCAQAKIVEELPRRAQQPRAAWAVTMADHFDPSAILKRLDDLRRNGHAPDILDVAARHGLAPRDDRKRLHDCARILGHPLRAEPLKEPLHAGVTLESPARGQLHQLQAARAPRLL